MPEALTGVNPTVSFSAATFCCLTAMFLFGVTAGFHPPCEGAGADI